MGKASLEEIYNDLTADNVEEFRDIIETELSTREEEAY